MTDAAVYFLVHARAAVRKARRLKRGAWRNRQRRVARVYHILARQAAEGINWADDGEGQAGDEGLLPAGQRADRRHGSMHTVRRGVDRPTAQR